MGGYVNSAKWFVSRTKSIIEKYLKPVRIAIDNGYTTWKNPFNNAMCIVKGFDNMQCTLSKPMSSLKVSAFDNTCCILWNRLGQRSKHVAVAICFWQHTVHVVKPFTTTCNARCLLLYVLFKKKICIYKISFFFWFFLNFL